MLRNRTRLASFGVGQQLRGRKHDGSRPTAVLFDDLEDLRDVKSPDQRANLFDWFSRTALFAGSGITNFFALGMRLNNESLLSKLRKAPDWRTLEFQAIERFPDAMHLWDKFGRIYNGTEEFEGRAGLHAADAFYLANQAQMDVGGKSLWPERWSLKELMAMRYSNPLAFDPEMQNNPINPADCYFPYEDIRLGSSNVRMVWRLHEVLIETNQFQLLYAGTLRQRASQQSVHLNIAEINHTSDKKGRIQGLQPAINSGQIKFSRRHHNLLEQLTSFPIGPYDNGPDALEMLMTRCVQNPQHALHVAEAAARVPVQDLRVGGDLKAGPPASWMRTSEGRGP